MYGHAFGMFPLQGAIVYLSVAVKVTNQSLHTGYVAKRRPYIKFSALF